MRPCTNFAFALYWSWWVSRLDAPMQDEWDRMNAKCEFTLDLNSEPREWFPRKSAKYFEFIVRASEEREERIAGSVLDPCPNIVQSPQRRATLGHTWHCSVTETRAACSFVLVDHHTIWWNLILSLCSWVSKIFKNKHSEMPDLSKRVRDCRMG